VQWYIILSFILFTGVVAYYTFSKLRKESVKGKVSKDNYFLGGRSLTWGVIGMSLLLTNLNATQFVGMSGQSFAGNMSNMAYEVTSGFVLALVAIYLLPRYLKQGITTIPEFLEDRYDSQVKSFVSILFLLGYVLNMLPTTLYSGAIALSQMFDIESTFHISYEAGIWIMVWLIGIIGFFYAVLGGLKAVAISDTFNGIALAIGGLLVPIFALLTLGDGSISQGFSQFVAATPEKFNAIGTNHDVVPFGAALTGLLLVNFYYWGTDQSIIQRALAAKDLKEGQKGIMFVGLMKIFTPIIVIIPGIMAFQIIGNTGANPDTMYSALVTEVMPKPLIGLFAAAMFGSVLSVFNGILNSASTLFAINVYAPTFGKNKSDEEIVRKGKWFGVFIALISMFIAPLIMYAPSGLFQYLQVINGFFNVPIFTIIFIGYVTKRVPAIAAKISITFFIATYAILQLVVKPEMSFLYQLAILFVISCLLMLIIGKIKPREEAYVLPSRNLVNLEPWKYRQEAAWGMIFCVTAFYIVFSKLGLASEKGFGVHTWAWLAGAALICLIGLFVTKKIGSRTNTAEPLEKTTLNKNVL
jgi:SSS family solute:Na+ symporter